MVEHNIGIENSLKAFQHAHDLGYRFFETDVRASKDGVVYAVHDDRLDRLSGEDVGLADLTSTELESMRLGGGEPFVRLTALMDAFPDANFNIDVKSDDALDGTLEVVRHLGAADRVCLASFSHARLRRIRALEPSLLTSASMSEAARMVLGIAPPRAPRFFQVPARHRGIPVVTRSFVDRVHRAGQGVHVWTIDEPAEMHRLLDLGVDGIMTDRTDLLKDVLLDRGQWKDPS